MRSFALLLTGAVVLLILWAAGHYALKGLDYELDRQECMGAVHGQEAYATVTECMKDKGY